MQRQEPNPRLRAYDAYENRRDLGGEQRLRLAHAVDRQEYVEFDEDVGLLYCWNGSLTVNVYDLYGNCVDMWTLGLTGDEPREQKRHEAMESIRSRTDVTEADDDD